MKDLFNKYMQFLGISNEGIRRLYLILVPFGFLLFFIVGIVDENDRYNSVKEQLRNDRNTHLTHIGVFKDGMEAGNIEQLPQEKKDQMVDYLENIVQPRHDIADNDHLLYQGIIIFFTLLIFILFNILIKITTWIFQGFVKNKELNK